MTTDKTREWTESLFHTRYRIASGKITQKFIKNGVMGLYAHHCGTLILWKKK